MNETLTGLISMYGYFGVFFLIFIENVFPPIPSEVILLFGGSLSVTAGLNVWVTAAAATGGSLLGAMVLYHIGFRIGTDTLKKLLSGRAGRVLRLGPDHVDRAERQFNRYRRRAVLLCRCVPVLRSIISIPAGAARMELAPFLMLTAVGSAVWNTALVLAGSALGTAWSGALPYLGSYSKAACAVIVLTAVAAVLIYKIKKRRKNKKTLYYDEKR